MLGHRKNCAVERHPRAHRGATRRRRARDALVEQTPCLGLNLSPLLARYWTGQVSWTLTLLVVGVTLGCLNAWYWMNQEGRRD